MLSTIPEWTTPIYDHYSLVGDKQLSEILFEFQLSFISCISKSKGILIWKKSFSKSKPSSAYMFQAFETADFVNQR